MSAAIPVLDAVSAGRQIEANASTDLIHVSSSAGDLARVANTRSTAAPVSDVSP
jgi:hypothetical protein